MTIYGQVAEYFISANSAMTIYSGLAVGAAHLIENFGTGGDRALFCEKMCNGVWGGTMCLTEPDAGSYPRSGLWSAWPKPYWPGRCSNRD